MVSGWSFDTTTVSPTGATLTHVRTEPRRPIGVTVAQPHFGRERARRDHRGGGGPAPGAHRGARAEPGAAPLPMPDQRRLPARGRGLRRRQPAVVRPDVRGRDPLGWSDRLPGARRRRQPDRRRRGPRGRRGAPRAHAGDPLRGVHAYYSASAREWWAPLGPGRQLRRRNALVGVLDKPSEFAGRAVHEWTRRSFGTTRGSSRRNSASWSAPNAARPASAAASATDPGRSRTPTSSWPRSTSSTPVSDREGPSPRWWEDVQEGDELEAAREGPLTVTDMICWHAGMGMGLLPVRAVATRLRKPSPDPALLPPDELNIPDVMHARPLGSRIRRKSGKRDHLRLRTHARDVAHPSLHRLGWVTTPGVDTRLRVSTLQLCRGPPLDARARHRGTSRG